MAQHPQHELFLREEPSNNLREGCRFIFNFFRMQSLYRIFTSAENRVAGGEGIVGVYGSLTGSSMSRIFSSMKMHSGFDEDSIL